MCFAQEVEASLREVEKRCLSACASMEHQMRQLYTQLQRRSLTHSLSHTELLLTNNWWLPHPCMAQPPSLIISAVYKLGFQWLTNPCRELALQGELSEMADLQVVALLEMVQFLNSSLYTISLTVIIYTRILECIIERLIERERFTIFQGSVLDGSVSRTVDLLVRASDCLKTDVTLMLSSDQVCACVCVCVCVCV